MSLVRDFPFTMPAIQERLLATCAALYTTGSTSVVTPIWDTTADSVITTGTLGALTTVDRGKLFAAGMASVNGKVIDRLRFPIGARYGACVVGAYIASTRGSTEANRKLGVGVKLQHGDSSAGGDLADYSTGNQPDDRQYFSSARTTDMLSWDGSESTGEVFAASNPGYYDLRAAKRYLRVVARAGKDLVTTESSGDEQSRVGANITFLAGDQLPQKADSTGPYSDTTSTA
jgi:hypothetical protein